MVCFTAVLLLYAEHHYTAAQPLRKHEVPYSFSGALRRGAVL
jgi:hypothetical protein